MSADNGTYILCTSGPEYRIAHFQAVENMFDEFIPQKDMWTPNVKFVYETFKEATVFNDLTKALDAANMMDESFAYSEYGVNLISDFEEMSFNQIEEMYHGSGTGTKAS